MPFFNPCGAGKIHESKPCGHSPEGGAECENTGRRKEAEALKHTIPEYDQRYRKGIKRITESTWTDDGTALAMIMLTATLMDLCPWDDRVADIVIEDCKRQKHVDLRESEPCAG